MTESVVGHLAVSDAEKSADTITMQTFPAPVKTTIKTVLKGSMSVLVRHSQINGVMHSSKHVQNS